MRPWVYVNNHKQTSEKSQQYAGSFVIILVMEYESRRSRRLRLERERRRQNQQKVVRFFVCVALLVVVSIVVGMVGRANMDGAGSNETKQVATDSADTDVANEEAQKLSPIEVLKRDLPAKLADINQQLGITTSADLGYGDLPAGTSTAISVVDLTNGWGRYDYNADVQFTSASTYKLYVAYSMIRDVEQGRRNWSSSLNGQTFESCLNTMIINSDNACPESYLVSNGYSVVNRRIREIGVSDQTQLALYDVRTTASDLSLMLERLYKGELMSEDNKNRLLSLMERQVYRWGIPTGVGDRGVVYDKVGWLDMLEHDAAIVSSDEGDYVLVIMTNGESREYLAKVSEYIHTVMTDN